MNIVKRNKIWFYAGDKPYNDLKIKETQFFIDFNKKFEYFKPIPGELAILADDCDDIDPNVPEWLWWILLDNNIYLYCSNSIYGIHITYAEKKKGISVDIDVTEDEAIIIDNKIKEMIEQAEEPFEEKQETIIKPKGIVIKYKVKPLIWRKFENLN
jgi:hypothetical protein